MAELDEPQGEENEPGDAATNPNVVARLALIGRHSLMPGIMPVDVQGRRLLVGHAYAPKLVDEAHGVEVDASDCTVFTVTHIDRMATFNLDDATECLLVLDDSLAAISEVSLWERAH